MSYDRTCKLLEEKHGQMVTDLNTSIGARVMAGEVIPPEALEKNRTHLDRVKVVSEEILSVLHVYLHEAEPEALADAALESAVEVIRCHL